MVFTNEIVLKFVLNKINLTWRSTKILSNGTISFPSSPNTDKSVSAHHFFPKKGKNKSKCWIVNLCYGETKDFVEPWEIIHLKKSELLFPSDK